MLDAGVGLWDTVAAATRKGNLDADIRLHEASDLAGFGATLPELRAIAFNGATSARIGRRQLVDMPGLALIDLPSSSPAYASLSFEKKYEAWLTLRDYLSPLGRERLEGGSDTPATDPLTLPLSPWERGSRPAIFHPRRLRDRPADDEIGNLGSGWL